MSSNDQFVSLNTKLAKLDQDTLIISGKVPADIVANIEQRLLVRLPESYKYFLKEYGTIDYAGSTLYGAVESVELDHQPILLFAEKLRNEFNLPRQFVPIYEWDSDIYMLDTSSFYLNECPVVLGGIDALSKSYEIVQQYASDFVDFVEQVFFEP